MAIILLCNNHLTRGTYWAYLPSVNWVGVSWSRLSLAHRVSGLLSQLGWHECLWSLGSHLFWADPSRFTRLSSFSWVSNLDRTHFPHDGVTSARITLETFQALILECSLILHGKESRKGEGREPALFSVLYFLLNTLSIAFWIRISMKGAWVSDSSSGKFGSTIKIILTLFWHNHICIVEREMATHSSILPWRIR